MLIEMTITGQNNGAGEGERPSPHELQSARFAVGLRATIAQRP